jgi:uncharacterized membrane protein
MSAYGPASPASVDEYLVRLRAALGSMPGDEAEEILREFRGHIRDRQESSADGSPEALRRILSEMGSPEAIGAQYRTDKLLARARVSYSPVVILRSLLRLASSSLSWLLAFLLAVTGYGSGIALIGCAAVKPFLPEVIGLWVSGRSITLGATSAPQGRELLGYWIVPLGLIAGVVLIVVTTAVLRWLLRFARPNRGR